MRIFSLALLALLVLSGVGTAQTVDELTKRLKDPDAQVRRLAAEALGRQKAEAAIPALVELLGDREEAVWRAAMDALTAIGAKAMPAVAGALKHSEESGRKAAVVTLLRMARTAKVAPPEGVLSALADALKDKSVDVRLWAAESLEKFGTGAKSALPALIEAAKDTSNKGLWVAITPTNVSEAAIVAALKIDPECAEALAKAALPTLIDALKNGDEARLMAAGSAIARLGPHAKTARPALEDAQKRAGRSSASAIRRALEAAGADLLQPLIDVVENSKAPRQERLRALGPGECRAV